MSHRTHRFDAWHLLAEPTFGAILAPAEGEASNRCVRWDISPLAKYYLMSLRPSSLIMGRSTVVTCWTYRRYRSTVP